jgi:histidine triad (HIT) family protein
MANSRKFNEYCEFCGIANGKIHTTQILFESENIVIFSDVEPASRFHFLAVPKIHIDNVMSLTKSDKKLGM